jgi:superoxide reductase
MQRRDFINMGLAGLGASFVAPKLVLAKSGQNNMAGGVFYTKQNPGRWSEKVAGHLPNIEIENTNGKVNVKVTTAHGMDGYKHYIIKHMLLDNDYKFLDEQLFDPMKDKVPLSSYTLENYKGTLYAVSMCNLHDVWLSSVEL